MTESLVLYSSANVYKVDENVYPVNTNVTLDGLDKGIIIGHKNICMYDYLTVY